MRILSDGSNPRLRPARRAWAVALSTESTRFVAMVQILPWRRPSWLEKKSPPRGQRPYDGGDSDNPMTTQKDRRPGNAVQKEG